MLVHNLLGYEQSKTGSFWALGRKEPVKEFLLDFFGYTDPIVNNIKSYPLVFASGADNHGEMFLFVRAECARVYGIT